MTVSESIQSMGWVQSKLDCNLYYAPGEAWEGLSYIYTDDMCIWGLPHVVQDLYRQLCKAYQLHSTEGTEPGSFAFYGFKYARTEEGLDVQVPDRLLQKVSTTVTPKNYPSTLGAIQFIAHNHRYDMLHAIDLPSTGWAPLDEKNLAKHARNLHREEPRVHMLIADFTPTSIVCLADATKTRVGFHVCLCGIDKRGEYRIFIMESHAHKQSRPLSPRTFRRCCQCGKHWTKAYTTSTSTRR